MLVKDHEIIDEFRLEVVKDKGYKYDYFKPFSNYGVFEKLQPDSSFYEKKDFYEVGKARELFVDSKIDNEVFLLLNRSDAFFVHHDGKFDVFFHEMI